MPIVPVVTATPAPPGTFPTNPLLQALSIPTDNALERQNASATRLYLTAFQSYDLDFCSLICSLQSEYSRSRTQINSTEDSWAEATTHHLTLTFV